MFDSFTLADTIPAIWQWLPLLSAVVLAWNVCQVVYNVYFHPLSRFPGPRVAAATVWWKIHLELVQQDSLCLRLWDLHAKYGDVVRIGPNELHFANPAAYNDIHNQRNRWDKDPYLYACFALHESTLSICEYDRAKRRRDVVNPLFSRKSVLNMQHLVQECYEAMCENIGAHADSDTSMNVFRAFRCAALENIFSMCFARTLGVLRAPQFRVPIERAMYAALPISVVFKHFPSLKYITEWLPESLVTTMNPVMVAYFQMRQMLKSQIKEVLTNPGALADWPHPTIYHEFLRANKVPGEQSLQDEALLFINAGTDTVSDTLSVGTLHVLADPAVHARLRAELLTAWPNLEEVPKYEVLESLPYLRAVIKESLRLGHGVVTPMTRVVPREGAHIAGTFIPGGTVVGISNTFVHWNESIFPNARTFDPERWLGADAGALDTWLVSFCKGPRSCLGINLAWCELYLGFANLFRRFELSLDGFRPEDLKWRDCYLPHYDEPETEMLIRARRRTV